MGAASAGTPPRADFIGSNAERRKLPRMDPEGVERSRPACRNRRRQKPAPAKPGDRGTWSVTVAAGPSEATRQEAGGSRAAGTSVPAAQGRPPSPASSTGGEFGPHPQIQLDLEEEDTIVQSGPWQGMDTRLVKTSWDEERGRTTVTATEDVVVPSCYALETVSRGTATEPPHLTVASTQTPRDEQGPVTAPPCSTSDQTPPTVTVTAEAATQWQDPDRTPPCPPGRTPMSSMDMIAMA